MIKFLLKRGGEATLEEISSALKIPKYGPNSAYAILYSLKSKNLVERRGGGWALMDWETSIPKEAPSAAEKPTPNVEESMKTLAEAVKKAAIIQKSPAEKPAALAEGEIEREETLFLKPEESYETAETLRGFKTGTFLDTLFFKFNGEPLDGVPASGQFMIAGPLGSGKRLLVGEILLRAASSGHKVLYLVLDDVWKADSLMFDLHSRMRLRAEALGLDWKDITANLHVLNPPKIDGNFIENYKGIIAAEKIKLAVFDPINSFELSVEPKEAGRILRESVRIHKAYGVTGFFIMHTGIRGEEAGQASVRKELYPAYLMDGIISVAPVQLRASGLEVEVRGSRRLRIAQVVSCRMCGFDERGVLISLADNGCIRPVESEG